MKFTKMSDDEWITSSRKGMAQLVAKGSMTQDEMDQTIRWQDEEKAHECGHSFQGIMQIEKESER